MKVTVEYGDAFEARVALQSLAYVEFVEEFEKFLMSHPGALNGVEVLDKFSALRDLYKI